MLHLRHFSSCMYVVCMCILGVCVYKTYKNTHTDLHIIYTYTRYIFKNHCLQREAHRTHIVLQFCFLPNITSLLSFHDSKCSSISFILKGTEYYSIIYLIISLLKNIWWFQHFAINSAAMRAVVQMALCPCAISVG